MASQSLPQDTLMTWDRLQPGRGQSSHPEWDIRYTAFPAKAGPTSDRLWASMEISHRIRVIPQTLHQPLWHRYFVPTPTKENQFKEVR